MLAKLSCVSVGGGGCVGGSCGSSSDGGGSCLGCGGGSCRGGGCSGGGSDTCPGCGCGDRVMPFIEVGKIGAFAGSRAKTWVGGARAAQPLVSVAVFVVARRFLLVLRRGTIASVAGRRVDSRPW